MSAISYINKNPIAVIGIFAGVVEIFGNIILPMLEQPLQTTYLWFLILFPTLLVIAFFITLNFNHKVLYVQSENQDESEPGLTRHTSAEAVPASEKTPGTL